MAVKLSRLQAIFKNIGKVIKLSQMAAGTSSVDGTSDEFKGAVMAAVDQATTGVAADYTTYQRVVAPFVVQVNNLTTSMDNFPAACKSTTETYLKQVVSVDVGLTSSASLASIGTALAAAFNAAVADDGTTPAAAKLTPSGSTHDGIAAYMFDNFAITLPQASGANIPDSYITDTVL